MNKKQYTLFALFACLLVSLVSCSDDDNNNYEVSEEWKAQQRAIHNEATARYNEQGGKDLISKSGNGSIHWMYTDSIKTLTPSARISKEGNPYINDTVTCRYKGWYFNEEGKQVVFDTTESENGYVERDFTVGGVIDGWTTALMDMEEGEEREIVIPHKLGYGEYGKPAQSTASIGIPGFTTLFFTVKIIKIKPVNPSEWTE